MPARIVEQPAGQRDHLFGPFPDLGEVATVGEPLEREIEGGPAERVQQPPRVTELPGGGDGPVDGHPGVRPEAGPHGDLVRGGDQAVDLAGRAHHGTGVGLPAAPGPEAIPPLYRIRNAGGTRRWVRRR